MADDEAVRQAQEQMALAQLQRDATEIVEIGRTHYGREIFDGQSQIVGDELGAGHKENFMDMARNFDRPHDIIAHLANNPGRLQEFKKLPPERQRVEMARIEANLAPFGNVRTGRAPMWTNPEVKSGRVSDEEWARTGGEGLSERQWHSEFSRRLAERSKRVC